MTERERKKLATAIWRSKHRDFRSKRGDETHPSVLVLNPRNGATELWPLMKITERDLLWLAKGQGVIEAAGLGNEFLEEQRIAVIEVEPGDTVRHHAEWKKVKRKKGSPTGGIELYFEDGGYMHVPPYAQIPITYED